MLAFSPYVGVTHYMGADYELTVEPVAGAGGWLATIHWVCHQLVGLTTPVGTFAEYESAGEEAHQVAMQMIRRGIKA